jgi:hypothetical protein
MNADHDSSRYYVDDTLLLKFLIARYTEMLQIKEPRLVPVWAGLGMVALYQNRDLENAFKTLISSDSYTLQDVLTASIDFFLVELDRLEAADAADYVEKRVERPPLSRRTARKFLFWSWSEGRKMSKEKDFRFYAVWELISWLTLTSDEYIKAFDERCRFSESPVEEKLRDGLDVVKAAIFGRRLDNNSFLADMLKSGITN